MIYWNTSVSLVDGTGRLELRDGAKALEGRCGMDAFLVDDKPIGMHWPDFAGSVGQEYYMTGMQTPREHCLCLADFVADWLRVEHDSLRSDLQPLLRQFPNGTYQLVLEEIEGSWQFAEWRGGTPDDIGWYWPFDSGSKAMVTLLPTLRDEFIDEARVHHWVQQIHEGWRPFAITARIGDAAHEYVLDGHHKLRAYERVPVRPWRLCICAPPTFPLTQEDWPLEPHRMPRPWLKLPKVARRFTPLTNLVRWVRSRRPK